MFAPQVTVKRHLPIVVQSSLLGLITAVAMLLAIPAGGIASLCILARLIERRPIISLVIWGAIYVPVSALWVFPAFDGSFEYALGIAGFTLSGMIFYGGAGVLATLAFRRIPVLIMPAALVMAEVSAASLGLVLAPIGLFAVDGLIGAILAFVTVFGTTALFGLMASILTRHSHSAFPIMFAAMFIIGLAPGPSRPAYNGPPIFGVSHNPDSTRKWSSRAYAAEVLETLKSLSEEKAGTGLTVWPENAITGTFNLDEAVALLDHDQFPILFGMTRFVRAGSPELLNSAVLVTSGGVQVSDKEFLVPVIETGMPYVDNSDLGTGTRKLLVLDDGTTILPLICYEAAFLLNGADLADRPDVIIILAAESGFAESLAYSIMRRHAKARELETGIRVERVSDYDGK